MSTTQSKSCKTTARKPMVTKMDRLLHRLRKGWLTTLQSINEIGLSSLSQQVSKLRRRGLRIADKWVTTPSGSRIKAYRWVA